MARSLGGRCAEGYYYDSITQRCEPNPISLINDLPTDTTTTTQTVQDQAPHLQTHLYL